MMDLTFKILVVGDTGVGKTTAIRKLIGRPFYAKAIPTVAFEFYSGVVKVAGKNIRLQFWDISGLKSKNSLGMSYASEVDAVVVVYDLTSFATFHCASQWIDNLYQLKEYPIFLFGNKLDLCFKNQGREVKGEEQELIKKVKGVIRVGSGFVDGSFEKGLIELVQKYLLGDVIFEGEEPSNNCCCFARKTE